MLKDKRNREYKSKFPRITEVSDKKGFQPYQFRLVTNYDQRLWAPPGAKQTWSIVKGDS